MPICLRNHTRQAMLKLVECGGEDPGFVRLSTDRNLKYVLFCFLKRLGEIGRELRAVAVRICCRSERRGVLRRGISRQAAAEKERAK